MIYRPIGNTEMSARIIVCVLITAFIFSITNCDKTLTRTNNSVPITSYRDIPGISEEEIHAIENLKTIRQKFTYGQMPETEAFELPDGSHAGFAVKFCNLLSGLFGIEFALEFHEWESLKSGLDNRQIDFTGDLTPTPERLEFYYMTHPIAERSQRIFFLSDNERIIKEADINNRNIGVLAGAIDINMVREYYPEVLFNTVEVDSFDSAKELLKSREIDAFITEGVFDQFFDENGLFQSKEFFPLVYTPVSMATANPDLESVITVINKYISAGGIDILFTFYKEGNDEYARYKLSKNLTDQEKDRLNNLTKNKQVVKIALEHDNYPVSFYNKTDKEFQGIAVDVLSEISHLLGIKFEIANNENTSWSEIMKMLRTGEVSIVSQLLFSDERKGQFLWTSVPYASTYYALISKSDFPNLAIYQIVRSKVGTISKSAYEDKYHQWLPDNNNTIAYNTQNEALDALESGDIDLMMASEYILLMQQNYREKPGYKVNIRFGIPMESFFGLNINEQILCSIINKAQTFVDTEIITTDWSSRGYDYIKEMTRQRSLLFMSMAIALGLMLILTFIFLGKHRKLNHSLDKTVKERTHELELQTQAAQVASKSKSVFLATMSHEIRTPLNAVIGMAGIAKKTLLEQKSSGGESVETTGQAYVTRQACHPDKILHSINQILSSSHHLLGILNDILDMSKIDVGKLELSIESFNIKEAYSEVSDIIEQRCQEKNIRFVTNTDKMNDIIVMGDKLRLNQVLINLLGNAIKFTPEGGETTLKINVVEESDKKVKLHYSISDTGIGITQEKLSRLFIPFEQADNKIATKFGGTGLGLSISQNLISMMGGEIKVQSKLNKGSNFYFDLTFDKGISRVDKKTEIKTINLTGKRILLVEDIEINRIIIRELLSATGVEIEEAENGQIALEMFDNSPLNYYNLIFMDVQMPIMGGYETTKQIRLLERPDSQSIPIIAMTANAYKEDIEEALSSGMNGHVPKPVDEEYLINTVLEFIGERSK